MQPFFVHTESSVILPFTGDVGSISKQAVREGSAGHHGRLPQTLEHRRGQQSRDARGPKQQQACR